MTEWRVDVNDGQRILTEADGLFDVLTVDTFNPFGDYARAFLDDLNGEIFDLVERGTKVSFQYIDESANGTLLVNENETTTIDTNQTFDAVTVEGDLTVEADLTVEDPGYTQDFVGFVVNDLENESDGAEEIDIEAYTFDQFLRGDEVSNDQTGNLISEALEDVIKTDVPPVDWNASHVDVVDDIELTRSYQGENVEEFILDLRQKSADESFGVTEDLEFFFRPDEVERTSRDISNDQWVTHDIGEEGGETRNQVVVSYADGNASVVVDNSSDQLQTQENLGASGPAQEADTITRPNITNIDDAIDEGERFLEGRASTLTGPVTTFGLTDAEPGNVIGVTVEPRGIDTDFRIAENRTRWRSETNELVVVEKKGADDDLLIAQSKTIKRVENRPRDTDVTPDRVTDTRPTAVLDVSVTASGQVDNELFVDDTESQTISSNQTFDGATIEGDLTVEADLTIESSTTTASVGKVVNDGRNRIRDGLINENEIQSFSLDFASDTDRPVRSDSNLSTVVSSGSPSVSTSAQQVTYSRSDSNATGVQTIGIFDDTQSELIALALLEQSVDNPSVDLSISIADDTNQPKSVITETGQNVVRDILAGTSADWASDYTYGSGTTEPSVTDTDVDTRVVTTDLDFLTLQDATDQSGFEAIVSPAETEPARVNNGQLEHLQVCFHQDARNDAVDDNRGVANDAAYVDGQAAFYSDAANFSEFQITPEYDIPAEEFGLQFRIEAFDTDSIDVNVLLDGETLNDQPMPWNTGALVGLDWYNIGFFTTKTDPSFDLEAGTTYTLRFEVDTDAGGSAAFDRLSVYDERYEGQLTFDNTVDGNQQLSGPQLYANETPVSLSQTATRRDVTEAKIDSTWNDTSNGQALELAIIDGSFETTTNSETASISVSDADADTTVESRVVLSRFGTDGTETPTQGRQGQVVSEWTLSGNPSSLTKENIGVVDVQGIIQDSQAIGSNFAEAALLSDSDVALTRSLIPEFTKQSQQVISAEKIRFNNTD